MEAADDNFTKQVLFWQDSKEQGANVDAEAEAKRMDAQKNGGQTAPPGGATEKPPHATATIDKDGWLDHLRAAGLI